MFAKLTFNPGTAVGGKIRDIVRLITESAAGTVSLSNLEFINVSGSYLHAGVNSGWTLASGSATLPAAGTAVSAAAGGDGLYYLEGDCITSSKKKHVAITLNGYYSAATNTTASIVAQEILDYGTATETRTASYLGTVTPRISWFGIAPSDYSQTIYISATPRKLVILGEGQVGNRVFAHLEFPETGMTTYHNTKPAVFLIDSTSGTAQHPSGASNFFATSSSGGPGYNGWAHRTLYFNKCLYDTENSTHIRSFVLHDTGTQSRYTPHLMQHEDGTTLGTTITTGSFYSNFTRGKHGSNPQDYRAVFSYLTPSGSSYTGELYTTSDQKILPLYPMHFDGGFVSAEDMNFSVLTNMYIMPKIGLWGDKMVIGSDTYYLFPMSNSNYVLKVE